VPASDVGWTYKPVAGRYGPQDFTQTGTKWMRLGDAYPEIEHECKVSLDGPKGSTLVVRSRAGIWQANVPGEKFVLTWAGTGQFYAPVAVSHTGTLTAEVYTIPQDVKVYYATLQFENHAPMASCFLPEPSATGVQVQLSIKEIVGDDDLVAHLNFPYMFGPMQGPDYMTDPTGLVWVTPWGPGLQNASFFDWAKAWLSSLPLIGPVFKALFDAIGGAISSFINWFLNLPNAFLSWIGVPEWLRPVFGWLIVLLLLVLLAFIAWKAWGLFVWLLLKIWLLVKFALFLIAMLILAVPYIIACIIDRVADKKYSETIGGWAEDAWGWVTGRGGEE